MSRVQRESGCRWRYASSPLAAWKPCPSEIGPQGPPLGEVNLTAIETEFQERFAEYMVRHLREVEAHFSVKIKRIAIDAPSDARRHSSFSSSSLRVVNGIVASPRQMFASLSPLWLSIKSQRKGSTFLPFMEHALSDISKVRLLFNVGANFGRGV
jgi:hypothetical protein